MFGLGANFSFLAMEHVLIIQMLGKNAALNGIALVTAGVENDCFTPTDDLR